MFVSRALQVVGPAVFTAQAAALVGLLLPHRLGQVTATIYLGWPLALVLGMPAAGWFTAVLGWPWVFATLGVLSLLTAAAVWHALAPFSTHAQPVRSAASRRIAAGVWPCLMTTAMASAAQLMLLTYFTSYGRNVLGAASTDLAVALTALGCLGVLGVAGVGRLVDRIGASRAVALCLTFMAASMLAWPLASTLGLSVLVLTPWALAAFALNAAQQARLLHLDAAAGPRNVGLNTSCVYLGQAVGAAMGGYWIAHHGYHGLGGASLGLLALAALASMFSSRQSINARPMHGDGRP